MVLPRLRRRRLHPRLRRPADRGSQPRGERRHAQAPTFDHFGPEPLEHAEAACAPDLAVNIDAIRRFLRACTAAPLTQDDWDTALGWNMVVAPEVRGALIARPIDTDDVLSDLSLPVLVTHGRADTVVLPSMAEHVLDVCEPAEPSWYDSVGHMPFLEDAARFDRELGAFAARVSRPRAAGTYVPFGGTSGGAAAV